MDIASYKAVTKPLAVAFEGEVINVTYRPNIYSLGLQRRLNAAKDDMDVDNLITQMSEFIASWDLMEDGAPLPLTPEGIEKVPLLVLAAIDNAIGEALIPSEEEKKGVVRAFGLAASGLYGNLQWISEHRPDLVEWVRDFRIADRLHVSPLELEDVPLVWVERTKMMLEIEAAERRALNARQN